MMRMAFFKGERSGQDGELDGLIRHLSHGPYSHCEIVFSDGMQASSTNVGDAGVRFKRHTEDASKLDYVDLPTYSEGAARTWFVEHEGQRYDYKGALRMADETLKQDPDK